MSKIILNIDGMHCDKCAERLENALKKKENIKSAKVSFETRKAVIEYENITKEQIEEYIEDIGFQSLGE
ncbi:MAG: heavy-metal-associated domain-containing protein [Bacilli bacterium]|nr:heavy-metal-associated domain-containing protein [Bacilli bacterium]